LRDWLHSFRMPLFFLISGFFGRMMLEKYSMRRYLQKRWYRIAIPLFVGLFTFGPAYILTRDSLALMRAPRRAGGFGPAGGAMPALSPGFVPPPLARFDENRDGSLSDAEWKKARVAMDGAPGGGTPPGLGPGGPGGGLRPGGPMPGPFGAPVGGLSERLFGSSAPLFHLNHLWFLWYLLVFVTVSPLVTEGLGWIVARGSPGAVDRLGVRLIWSGLAPVVLGVVSAPALMQTSGPFGWSLGMPESIFLGFPDFLLSFDVVMPFYFLFFLAGWWLHREREALPSVARGWPAYLIVGTIAFVAATWLSDTYARRADLPHYALLRWGGYTLYCVASAATGFAFLGFFQKHLDKPSPTWRYLADTALWVYLVHQPLVIVGLYWLAAYRFPWWAQMVTVPLFASAVALLLYEAVVQPTFLVYVLGPATPRRSRLEGSLQDRAGVASSPSKALVPH
jgi:surface polysaccharide O-acyltransferase-like enzyme